MSDDLLEKIQEKLSEASQYGRSPLVFLLCPKPLIAELRSLEQCNNASAIAFLRQLDTAVGAIKGPEDHDQWNGLYETLEEVTFFLLAHRRSISLEAIPTTTSSTPDFRLLGDRECWFEMKSINVRNGAFYQAEVMEEAIENRAQTEDQSKSSGLGFSTQIISPSGPGASPVDAVELATKKISSNVKSGQFANTPTVMVVSLGRVILPVTENPLKRTFVDTTNGQTLSGCLWHIAAGRRHDKFIFSENDYSGAESKPLQVDGVLREHTCVDAIIFISPTWSSLGNDKRFEELEYKLRGVYRDGANAELIAILGQLCDETTVV